MSPHSDANFEPLCTRFDTNDFNDISRCGFGIGLECRLCDGQSRVPLSRKVQSIGTQSYRLRWRLEAVQGAHTNVSFERKDRLQDQRGQIDRFICPNSAKGTARFGLGHKFWRRSTPAASMYLLVYGGRASPLSQQVVTTPHSAPPCGGPWLARRRKARTNELAQDPEDCLAAAWANGPECPSVGRGWLCVCDEASSVAPPPLRSPISSRCPSPPPPARCGCRYLSRRPAAFACVRLFLLFSSSSSSSPDYLFSSSILASDSGCPPPPSPASVMSALPSSPLHPDSAFGQWGLPCAHVATPLHRGAPELLWALRAE